MIAEQKLTNEEIARVFAMYLGCDVFDDYENRKSILVGVRKIDLFIQYRSMVHSRDIDLNEVKLLLTPLSAITDEHAIEITNVSHPTVQLSAYQSKTWLKFTLANFVTHDGFKYGPLNPWIFQFLIQQGCAVPLFFGIDHWANGKTAIELGIAIDKNK